MVVVVVTFFTSLAMISTVFPMSVDTARIVCGAVFMKLSGVCLSVCPIAPRRVCCCGRHGQAISIDCCTARLQQARPPCDQWCIAKNGGGYTQTGAAKGLKVPCLFMITVVSIRCQKNPGGWYTPYTRVYPPPQYTTACDPYPRQHGAQMRAVTCLQRRSKLDTDLIKERLDHCKLHSAGLSTLHVTQIGIIHVAPQVTAKFIYTIKVF